jgi:hypothetical protein
MKIGQKKPLDQNDLPDPVSDEESQMLTAELEK